MNRKTVYKLVSAVGEISKAEISRQTGISSPTVLKIAGFLLENGFVIEAGEGDSALGRKPQLLRFNPDAAFSIGVKLDGDHLRLGIVNLLGDIKTMKQVGVKPDFDNIIGNELVSNINCMLADAEIPRDKILGIGLGIPGVLDPEKQLIEFAPLIGIDSARECRGVLDALYKNTGLPVYIENDVNAAAIGEYVVRRLSPEQDLIYVSLGTGLGAGIILDGRLRRGKRNSAGEIGYMVFDRDFKTLKSRAGWMESHINLQALSSRWGYSPSHDNEFTAPEDKAFLIDHVASNLALCIANLSVQIDTDLVVIGGITVKALGDELLKAVRNYLSRLCFFDIECQSQLCKEPSIAGAASIATETRLDALLAGS